jgi:hypothetical protein
MTLRPALTHSCLALSALLTACGTPPPPETPAPATSASTPPVPTSSAAASAATAPSGTPSAAASAASKPTSPLQTITELPSDASLFALGARGFVSDGRHLLSIEGDDLVFDPAMMAGIEARSADTFWRIDRMGGTWPDGAFLTVMLPEERTGFSQHHRWLGTKWKQEGRSQNSESTVGFAPWSEGRTLAMFRSGSMVRARFEVVAGKKGGPMPTPTAPSSTPTSICATRLNADAFTALPSGEVFMAGTLCDTEGDASVSAAERWAPGKSKGVLETLPGAAATATLEVDGLVARSPSEVFLIGHLLVGKENRPYFARFDGTRWIDEPPPMTGFPAGLWLGPNGVLWTASGETIWSRAPGSTRWAPMALPQDTKDGMWALHAQSVWPRGPGDLWVLATGPKSGRLFLMHTRPATKPIKLPDPEEIAEEVRTRSMPAPLTAGCETPFVLIYTVGKSAPPDYDFPATRAALKGHTELADATLVEVKRVDKRYLGAKVASAAMAQKLVELIKQKVQGSTPQATCYNPKVTRALDLDYTTGELRK